MMMLPRHERRLYKVCSCTLTNNMHAQTHTHKHSTCMYTGKELSLQTPIQCHKYTHIFTHTFSKDLTLPFEKTQQLSSKHNTCSGSELGSIPKSECYFLFISNRGRLRWGKVGERKQARKTIPFFI